MCFFCALDVGSETGQTALATRPARAPRLGGRIESPGGNVSAGRLPTRPRARHSPRTRARGQWIVVATLRAGGQHVISGSLALASLNHTCRDLVPTFPQRSPPLLLTIAACDGLRSTPDCRPRRAFLHLSYSYAPPCGPALLVTQCHEPTYAVQQIGAYSITSSGRASSVGDTSSPNALAVWRLMTSANLLACTTGKFAGLAPLRMRPV